MLSILINAYACSPDMGSEPGMAWNWCVNLANYCELHIITEGEFRDKIEAVKKLNNESEELINHSEDLVEAINKFTI